MNRDSVNCITINTDASFDSETGAGGYAFWIVCNHFVIKKAGFFKGKTNNCNEAEVKCIANALSELCKQPNLPISKFLVINTDSKQGMSMIKQRKNKIGERTNDLWKTAIKKIQAKVSKFKHVKAHTNADNARSYVNNWCDEEAKKHMKVQRQILLNQRSNEEEKGI